MKELHEKVRAALLAARGIIEAAEKDAREFTADERQKIQGYLEEAQRLKAQIQQAKDDDALRKALADLGGDIGMTEGGDRRKGESAPRGRGATMGEQFVSAPAFKEWMAHVAPSGQISESAKGLMSPPVEFKDLLTGTSPTSAGAFVTPEDTGIYEPLGRRPLTIRQLISNRTTGSDAVEFVRQTVQVQQAAPVPEANVTDYTGATGQVEGRKPEGRMAFERVQEPVRTIAVWIPATKRALADAGQLRGIIDQELRDDLADELEGQLISGDGVGENLRGVLNTTGVLEQDFDTNIHVTARKARTALATVGRARPTAYVFNPVDWEAFDLATDSSGRYYHGGPLAMGEKRLWGLPVVESEAVPEGVGLLGDWRKAVLWDRERASIQVSDSHNDFFIRNMIAILAEMRAAFGIIRPSAFIEIELTAGS